MHESGYYRFDPQGSFQFDVDDFRKLVNTAQRLPEGIALRRKYYQEATSLYEGRFLPEFYSDWCEFERDKLESRFFELSSALAQHHIEVGEYDRASAISQRILEIDTLNEEALSLALVSYARSGNLPAATYTFKRYQETLEKELGCAPSPKIRDLYHSLIN